MPAPLTPPILAELVAAHRIFLKRKRQEFEDWCNEVAEEIDLREAKRREAEEFLRWIEETAREIDSPIDLE